VTLSTICKNSLIAIKWWEYLNRIWIAYETADMLDISVLAALQVHSRQLKALRKRPAGQTA
jgi:hypothetical protein